jgi:hypothetical protein
MQIIRKSSKLEFLFSLAISLFLCALSCAFTVIFVARMRRYFCFVYVFSSAPNSYLVYPTLLSTQMIVKVVARARFVHKGNNVGI